MRGPSLSLASHGSIGHYFNTMLDQSMNWQDAESVRKKWAKQFCLKGIMSVTDAKRAVAPCASSRILLELGFLLAQVRFITSGLC